MTTYSLYGFEVTNDDAFFPGGTLQISVPQGVKRIAYQIDEPADPSDDGDLLPDISFVLPQMSTTRIDGDFTGDVSFEMGRITWSSGTDILLIADLDTEARFGPDRQLFISLEGVFHPRTEAEFQVVAGSLREQDGTVTEGPFAPDTLLNYGALPFVKVSQHDLLIGVESNDVIPAGRGNDTLVGGAGDDEFIGGSGYDILDYFIESEPLRDTPVRPISVNANRQTVTDSYGDTDTYKGIEAIYGSIFADTFRGPKEGSLTVTGSQFSDTIIGSQGAGTTIVDYSPEWQWGGWNGIRVRLGAETATDGFGDTDTLIRVDGVRGSRADDDMRAGKTAVEFWGLGGADKLIGGRSGDRLDGGRGKDVLTGKGGQDTFVYAEGYGRDRIADFNLTKDSLEIDAGLLESRVTTGQRVVDVYGDQQDGRAVLDFGAGQVLILTGVDDLDALAGRIDIV